MTTSLRTALVLLTVSVPLLLAGSAQAGLGDVVRVANAEQAKVVVEKMDELFPGNGDNIPRYYGGSGAVAPYAVGSLPWNMTFASWVLQKAGYKSHLRGTPTMKIHSGGRAVAYAGSMTAAARKAGKIRQAPRPGYLAMYGNKYVEIVTKVNRSGRVTETIAGNTHDSVARSSYYGSGDRGITHFIAPW